MQFETTIYVTVPDDYFDDMCSLYVDNETDVEQTVDDFIRNSDYEEYYELDYVRDEIEIELRRRLEERGLLREDD